MHGPNGGVVDGLDEAKAAFGRRGGDAGWENPQARKNEPARIFSAGGFLSDRRVSWGAGGGADQEP